MTGNSNYWTRLESEPNSRAYHPGDRDGIAVFMETGQENGTTVSRQRRFDFGILVLRWG